MPRVLLVSASIGAGHTRAAAELERRLAGAGCRVHTVDVIGLGHGEGDRMRATYAWLLRRLPIGYDLAMRFWARWPAPLEHFVAGRARGVEADLLSIAAAQHPDLIVSLYNLASQCLGRLRASGELSAPVVTYVIDPGAHPYWVHPGVDRHLTVLPDTARRLRGYGARDVRLVAPLVRPVFTRAQSQQLARQRLHLPRGPLVLLTAGSWACGRMLDTLDLLLDGCEAVPLVLCADDAVLRRRVARRGRAMALGWVEDMPSLLSACDVVVDNAGGLTCWEALIARRPVVVYNPLPGHGRLNAATLAADGLVRWVRRRARLAPAVHELAVDAAAAARQAACANWLAAGDDPARAVLQTLGCAA